MKRLLGFIFFISLIVVLGITQKHGLCDYIKTFDECYVSCPKSAGAIYKDAVYNGSSAILTFSKNDFNNFYPLIDTIYGITLKIDNGKAKDIINSLHVSRYNIEKLDTCVVYTGYSSRLNTSTTYDRHNIQIAEYDNYILVGYPLILQSF